MRHRIRLDKIEARIQQKASRLLDVSLLTDEELEAIIGGHFTDEELEELIASLPENMLGELERAYGGPDE